MHTHLKDTSRKLLNIKPRARIAPTVSECIRQGSPLPLHKNQLLQGLQDCRLRATQGSFRRKPSAARAYRTLPGFFDVELIGTLRHGGLR